MVIADALGLSGAPLYVNLLLFAACAAGVWIAGTRLTVYADEVAGRKHLARGLVGLIFLASATELPEIVTTLTAAVEQKAKLVLGNMYGGIALQTTILAVVDAFFVRAALSGYPRKPTNVLEAVLLILLLGLILGFTALEGRIGIAHVGAGSIILAATYLTSIFLLRGYDEHVDWVPVDLPAQHASSGEAPHRPNVTDLTLNGIYIRVAACCAAILFFGTLIVQLADSLAVQTGLGQSFVGATFLAATTSLPELSTTITAARLGAYTMAISNIFGSNLIMVVLLLPADIAYSQGRILAEAGPSEIFAIIVGIVVSAIYAVGLLVRRKPRFWNMGLDSVLILTVYVASLFALYALR